MCRIGRDPQRRSIAATSRRGVPHNVGFPRSATVPTSRFVPLYRYRRHGERSTALRPPDRTARTGAAALPAPARQLGGGGPLPGDGAEGPAKLSRVDEGHESKVLALRRGYVCRARHGEALGETAAAAASRT